MREEIMMILGMLEEGKITSDQAALLIEAVVETVGLYDLEEPLPSFKDDAKNAGECHHHESAEKPGGEGVKGVADKLSGLADVVDRAALERLVERIRDTLEGAVKSTDQFMGRIQREVMSRKRTNGSSDWVLSLSTNVEKVVDGSFQGEDGKKIDVKLSTWNGRINVEPWDEPGFRVTVTADAVLGRERETPSEADSTMLDDVFEYDVAGDSLKVKLHDSRAAVRGASLNVKLPRRFVYDMDLETQNGHVSVGELECRMVKVETSNGRIELDNTYAVISELETSNGRIVLTGVTKRLSARTSNGPIRIVPKKIEGDSLYELATSNGSIEVQVADADQVGYHIDAKTGLGRIVIDLPNVAYQVTDKGYVRGEVVTETSGFSEKSDRLTIKARTSNGKIRIIGSRENANS
ncbi:MAG: DUF4097 family beta strand repeat-containing protein [Firmicutes bacterium]|nr:DUF4097 family beta strand repeat-containing protein [Bacillota bacterium]